LSRGRATRLGRFEAAAVLLLAATTPAGAVDPGDCCADLDARIAEFEATTARKGNRAVSVEISGSVNNAILSWDDGVEHKAYVVTNDNDRRRFRCGVPPGGRLRQRSRPTHGIVVQYRRRTFERLIPDTPRYAGTGADLAQLFWATQAGIERRFNELGKTTIMPSITTTKATHCVAHRRAGRLAKPHRCRRLGDVGSERERVGRRYCAGSRERGDDPLPLLSPRERIAHAAPAQRGLPPRGRSQTRRSTISIS
jgi:hypothetical protein